MRQQCFSHPAVRISRFRLPTTCANILPGHVLCQDCAADLVRISKPVHCPTCREAFIPRLARAQLLNVGKEVKAIVPSRPQSMGTRSRSERRVATGSLMVTSGTLVEMGKESRNDVGNCRFGSREAEDRRLDGTF